MKLNACLFIIAASSFSLSKGRRLNTFVRHFEPLSYKSQVAFTDHARVKRTLSETKHVLFRLYAHNRHFHLRLFRDASVFHQNFMMETEVHGRVPVNTNHLYKGHLAGDRHSHVYGAFHNGIFEGRIQTNNTDFYVESAWKFFQRPTTFHSVFYTSHDVQPPHGTWCGVCGDTEKWMNEVLRQRKDDLLGTKRHWHHWQGRRLQSATAYQNDSTSEKSRHMEQPNGTVSAFESDTHDEQQAVSSSRRVCTLEVVVDHTLFRRFSDPSTNRAQTRQQVTSQIALHVEKLNQVYKSTNFDGVQGVRLLVKRIKINDSSDCTGERGQSNPFCTNTIDSPDMLQLLSHVNHDDVCLSFAMTFRDFTSGVLGLAWVAAPQYPSTGICGRRPSGKSRADELSLNTGVVTFLNYNAFVPMINSELTLIHEVGHSFGSPHDNGSKCAPGEPHGNYIMYPYATRGTKPNNDKFSPCSIGNISRVLVQVLTGGSMRINCFEENDGPLCGNGIKEADEHCDCGLDETDCQDKCCFAKHNAEDAKGCTLRPGMACSPSAGSCCSSDCTLLAKGAMCMKDNECTHPVSCDGVSAECPRAIPKPNTTLCNNGTQLCLQGACLLSICEKYGATECTLLEEDFPNTDLCLIACSDPRGDKECHPMCHFPNMREHCGIRMMPGSPCNEMRGYCDVFQKCRLVDAEGPISRLESILKSEPARSVTNLISDHIIISIIVLVGIVGTLLVCFRLCEVHAPTSSPTQRPVLPLKDTLKHLNPHEALEGAPPDAQRSPQASGDNQVNQ